MKVLIVCTGNTCRSPMAVAAWQTLSEELRSGIEVQSAGTLAHPGFPASPQAREAVREWGASLESHRARRVDSDMLRGSDLVCAVTAEGATTLRKSFPESSSKVRVLDTDHDIADPYGGSAEEYQAAAAQLRRAVEGLAVALQNQEARVI